MKKLIASFALGLAAWGFAGAVLAQDAASAPAAAASVAAVADAASDRKSTRLNSSHSQQSRMPSSA